MEVHTWIIIVFIISNTLLWISGLAVKMYKKKWQVFVGIIPPVIILFGIGIFLFYFIKGTVEIIMEGYRNAK